MSSRPLWSGGCTVICRSKRPGRRSAGSSTSGRFVAARTTTPSAPEKPSISVRIWFSVCSRSSWPPNARAPPRARPIVSISSMKMIAGATFRASPNSSRTRLAPTPTIISMKSDALAEKKRTPRRPGEKHRPPRLSRRGAREQRLTGTGLALQQYTLRRPRPQPPVLVRILQVVDDLLDLRLDLVDAGDVGERYPHTARIDRLLLPASSADHSAETATKTAAGPLPPEQPPVERRDQDERAE